MSQCTEICRCNPDHPRIKFALTVEECQKARHCRLENQKCKACGETKPMPIFRYWCDECFYTAHGWC